MPLKKHVKHVIPVPPEEDFDKHVDSLKKKISESITILDIAKECVRDKYKGYMWDEPVLPEEYCISHGVDPDAVRRGLL